MRKGFSLAESVVTLVIAGVLLTIAVPRFSAMQDAAATRSAAADLDALFATARHLAITRRTTVAIRLDTVRADVEVRSAAAPLVRRALGATYGVSMSTTRDSSAYDARGLGYGAANLTVVLRRGRAVDTMVVSRLGRVRSAW